MSNPCFIRDEILLEYSSSRIVVFFFCKPITLTYKLNFIDFKAAYYYPVSNNLRIYCCYSVWSNDSVKLVCIPIYTLYKIWMCLYTDNINKICSIYIIRLLSFPFWIFRDSIRLTIIRWSLYYIVYNHYIR